MPSPMTSPFEYAPAPESRNLVSIRSSYGLFIDGEFVSPKDGRTFKTIDPDYIVPEHCTGPNTIFAIHRQMPTKLVMPSTGTRVVFGA